MTSCGKEFLSLTEYYIKAKQADLLVLVDYFFFSTVFFPVDIIESFQFLNLKS